LAHPSSVAEGADYQPHAPRPRLAIWTVVRSTIFSRPLEPLGPDRDEVLRSSCRAATDSR
jgi:hypothetical protein